MGREALDVDSESLVLTDFEALFGALTDGNKEVLHLLIIDLQHGQSHRILFAHIVRTMDPLEYLLAADGHNSLIGTIAHHRIRFSGASLTIGEQTAVVALPRVVEDFGPNLLVD